MSAITASLGHSFCSIPKHDVTLELQHHLRDFFSLSGINARVTQAWGCKPGQRALQAAGSSHPGPLQKVCGWGKGPILAWSLTSLLLQGLFRIFSSRTKCQQPGTQLMFSLTSLPCLQCAAASQGWLPLRHFALQSSQRGTQHKCWLPCKAERQLLGSCVLVQPGTPEDCHPAWHKQSRGSAITVNSIRCTPSAIHSCQAPLKALTSLQRVLSFCKTEALAKEQVTHPIPCALSLRHGAQTLLAPQESFGRITHWAIPHSQRSKHLWGPHTDFSDQLLRWTVNSSEPSQAGNQVHPHIAPLGQMGTSPRRHPAAPGSPGWDGDEHKQLRLWVALGTHRTGLRAGKQH